MVSGWKCECGRCAAVCGPGERVSGLVKWTGEGSCEYYDSSEKIGGT
jgi:hypothetical protein